MKSSYKSDDVIYKYIRTVPVVILEYLYKLQGT